MRGWEDDGGAHINRAYAEGGRAGLWGRHPVHGVGCESPIERLMLLALIDETDGACTVTDAHGADVTLRLVTAPAGPRPPLRIALQVWLEHYRADITVEGAGKRLVVECDGYDWHGGDGESWVKDRARDRFMQRLGWAVYRFPGPELWAAPSACAREVLAFFDEPRR
jgi:hypothetical protein